MRTRRRAPCLALLLASLVLAGCASLNALHGPTQDFYDAATQLVSAETMLLSNLNASIARSYLDRTEANYLAGRNIDLSAAPPQIPQPSIQVRVQAVQAVQLYAERLLDLTSGQPHANIDSYSEATAQSFKKLAPNSVPPNAVAGVTAAFTGIANVILDQQRYTTIVAAARDADPHLQALAALIRNDDDFIRAPLQAAAMVGAVARQQILEAIRADQQAPKHAWHTAFREVAGWDPLTDSSARQTAVEQLADALVRANAALARGDERTFAAIARDAVNRAVDISNVFWATKSGL